MRQLKLGLLRDELFLLGLITLLANDLVLKYEVGGLITGKLSDISGLFIFPFFWSIFFESHRLKIYILTILTFILWKLPLSTEVINTVNLLFGTEFYRVIDYTDLLTLIAVPISYKYLNNRIGNYRQQNQYLTTAIIISLVSILAFIATSLPKQELRQKININKKLICNVGKDEIFRVEHELSDKLESNLSDTTFRITFDIDKFDSKIETCVKIYSLGQEKTIFELDSLDTFKIIFSTTDKDHIEYLKNLKGDAFIDLFKKYVIEKIEGPGIYGTNIYFENPKLDAAY